VTGPIDITQGGRSGSTEVPHPAGAGNGGVSVDVTQRSVGELLREVTSDLSKLVNQEIELAKAEMKVEAKKTAGAFGGAAVAGYFALLFLSWTVLYALKSLFDSFFWAALVVTAIYAVVAAVLFTRARATARTINPTPEQTVQTLKEDAAWAQNRKS
jgi:uncharacterized membrane protein YqjE